MLAKPEIEWAEDMAEEIDYIAGCAAIVLGMD